MTRKLELLGKRFGRLTVITTSESIKGKAYWLNLEINYEHG